MVPYGAGGGADSRSRQIAQKMSVILKQPIIVDNKPGAGGNIGTEFISRAAPDGYLLLANSIGPISINPTLFGNLAVNPQKALDPVALLGDVPNILVVPASSGIKTWKEFIQDNSAIKARAKEALVGADEHYNMLIKEAWRTVEQADAQDALNVKAQSLKLIADIEAKRITMLQQVGLLDNAEMATQLAETERKQDILVTILKEVTATCPKCKLEVAKRLSQITGIVEPVIIKEEEASAL